MLEVGRDVCFMQCVPAPLCVEYFRCLMEYVAEHSAVNRFRIRLVWFSELAYIGVEETDWAAQIGVDGCRREGAVAPHGVESFHHKFVLFYFREQLLACLLSCLQRQFAHLVVALYELLEHEAAHFARIGAFRAGVVADGHVGGALKE